MPTPQHLYLIRHAQSQANADHVVAGSHESPLSALGREQARFAGQTAKLYIPFDLIVSSPMSRALDSARLIAEQAGYSQERVVVLSELRERNLGNVEGRDYSQAPHHNGNYEDAENVPGVEPIEQLLVRMKRVLEQLRARPERRVLVVCHNGSGRMLQVAANGGQAMEMYQQPRLSNAVIYRLS